MERKLTDIIKEEWKYRLTKIPGAFLEFWTSKMSRNENPQMFDFLQHMGDVWEGYMSHFLSIMD